MLGARKAKRQSQPRKDKKPKSIDMNAVSTSFVHQHTRHLDTRRTKARKVAYPRGMKLWESFPLPSLSSPLKETLRTLGGGSFPPPPVSSLAASLDDSLDPWPPRFDRPRL